MCKDVCVLCVNVCGEVWKLLDFWTCLYLVELELVQIIVMTIGLLSEEEKYICKQMRDFEEICNARIV